MDGSSERHPPSADDAFDELLTAQLSIRYHWQELLSVVRALPGDGFADRIDRVRRQIAESGAVRTIGPDGSKAAPAWALEPLPMMLTPPDWTILERAVKQRARLLNTLLADIYGPQRLLGGHVIPPALVHANPQFMRPCRVRGAPGPTRPLVLYAVDIIRGPDGSWAFLADHAQTPAGAGYCLFLRRALARALPEALRAVPVRDIGPFFEQWQAALRRCAPEGIENPKIALLTPGPYAQTYFEQAYLARTLGIPLVEGGDLTARKGGVLLKTLEGLKPIDVLLRRLDSNFCDPLELRADSSLGISGLVEAVRAGSVGIANALGSGVIEAPGLLPFLPGLAHELLGEKLELPSVDVWWLGERPAYDHAMEHAEQMIFRPAFAGRIETIRPGALDGAARREALDRIRARPEQWVAQYPLVPSLAPSWAAQGLLANPVIFRLFAVADGDDYAIMPGGLVRTPDASPLESIGRIDGQLRDLWVIAEDRDDIAVPPPTRFQRLPIQRGGDLQSRVADNLFWLGRYTERLDNAARLVRAALNRIAVGAMAQRDLTELRLLGLALRDAKMIDPQVAMAHPGGSVLANAVMRFAAPNRPISSTLSAIKRLANFTRDRLSADMVATLDLLLDTIDEQLRNTAGNIDQLLAALDAVIRFVATFSGLSQENVTRGSGWRFLDLGRRIERGYFTCRGNLSAFMQSPIAWEPAMRLALELSDSTITYRSRYLGALEPAPVLDLVLLDESNPRSVSFQLLTIERHLAGLDRATGTRAAFASDDLLADLNSSVGLFEADERAWRHEGLALANLRTTIDAQAKSLAALSDELTRAYFSLLPEATRLGLMAS